MNVLYRLLTGPNGPNYSPSTSSNFGGNSGNGVMPSGQPTIAPMSIAAPDPNVSPGFIEVPLVSQAFGPLPTGFGIAVKDGMIEVDTSSLQGNIEGGTY